MGEIKWYRTLVFRVSANGIIQAGLQAADGTWLETGETARLPCGLYVASFNKWAQILKELDDLVNSPATNEQDMQAFFERYPDILAGRHFDVAIPQARIVRGGDSEWRADFILHPLDQLRFCQILELKLPEARMLRRGRAGHAQFYAELMNAINQLRDYGEAFHDSLTRAKFKDAYGIDVYRPDLHLVIGRRAYIQSFEKFREVQRRHSVEIEDWDTLIDRLRRELM